MWSTSGFFVKAPWFEGWPGPVLAFWRVFFASLVLLPLIRQPRWTWRLLPMVATFAAMNWFYLSAMVETTAANAIWLQYTAPAWVFLVSAFILREPVQRSDWMLLLFAGAGVLLILWFECQGSSVRGVVFGLLSGVTFAGIAVSLRWLRDLPSAWLVGLNHTTAALVLAPYGFLSERYWPSGWQWGLLAGLGVFQLGLPYFLFARGVRTIPSHEAAGISLLEPLLVPVWVFLAWHSQPSYVAPKWWTITGGALILCGLIIRYAGQSRRASGDGPETVRSGAEPSGSEDGQHPGGET